MLKKTFILLITIIMFIGCSNATTVPEQKSNLTVGIIKKEIIKGKTTQEEILRIFGSPNIITTNSRGNEVWNYSKSSYQSNSSNKGFGWSLILIGGTKDSVLSNSSTSSLDLIITFNSKGIVEDYKVISSSF